MPSNKFYPSLRTAARTADIPELPGSFNEKIESLLKKIFYRNLTIDRSLDNSAQGIYAELMIYDALRFELFGNKGINLIFNPSYEDNTISVFPISMHYEIGILKYLDQFNIENFSRSPEDFLDLVRNLFKTDSLTIFVHSLDVFFPEESDVLQAFVDDYNQKYSDANISMPSDDTFEENAEDIQGQVEGYSGEPIVQVLFNDYIGKGDNSALGDVNSILFNELDGHNIEQSLSFLFKPKIKISVEDITVGVEFPTHILRKWDEVNEQPVTDNGDYVRGRLDFNLGQLSYDSNRGFEAFDESSFSFDKCEILESGFTLMIDSAEFLPGSGLTGSISSLRIREAEIGLPPVFQDDQNASGDPAKIKGTNLELGPGGFTGKITLDPGDELDLKLGSQDGFSVKLDKFSLTLQHSAFKDTLIKGYLKIPGFKQQGSTDDAKIGIEASFENNGDFHITADQNNGLQIIEVPDVMKININSLEVGREDNDYYIALYRMVESPRSKVGARNVYYEISNTIKCTEEELLINYV